MLCEVFVWIGSGISIMVPNALLLIISIQIGSGTFRHQPFGRQYGLGHMGDKSVYQMG